MVTVRQSASRRVDRRGSHQLPSPRRGRDGREEAILNEKGEKRDERSLCGGRRLFRG